MRRREFITLLGGVLVTWPSCARAEQASKIHRIGFMVTGSLQSPEQQAIIEAFQRGLRERGYAEGRNIVIEYAAADGKVERFTELARQLVSRHPDLIVASNTPAARAAKGALQLSRSWWPSWATRSEMGWSRALLGPPEILPE
jgi:ABC-type uncharacterized transport system substrate-binding protein